MLPLRGGSGSGIRTETVEPIYVSDVMMSCVDRPVLLMVARIMHVIQPQDASNPGKGATPTAGMVSVLRVCFCSQALGLLSTDTMARVILLTLYSSR